ncbi:YcaO-like family protein [Pseudomonas cedrina subsp. fulgida]|nr:YcaO-like family protein [Pseudomonas cedrina subsp. fulgida]
MHKPDLPGTLLFQPACILTLPNSVEVSDSLAVNGSGVGGGSNSIKTALGEYFERRHFYREVISVRRGRLSESLIEREVFSFAKAFGQTASKKISTAEIERYEFAMSEVVRASDFSKCLIPTACISLSSRNLGKDSLLYPLRDTCGCCFHWDPNVAFLGALKEYLERQFLIRLWLTKKCYSRISVAQAEALLIRNDVRHLYNVLAASGEITFLDITDPRFPGFCILVAFGQSKVKHHVKYCAGMAYASDLSVAMGKSLLELWQTFRFVDLFKATDSEEKMLEDSYIRYFLSCNAYETYQDITDVSECGAWRTSQNFTISQFLSILKRLGISGYFYAKLEKFDGGDGVFVKYVSPDLFLHMNNSNNFNLINKYSSAFKSSILRSRLEKMVPFP